MLDGCFSARAWASVDSIASTASVGWPITQFDSAWRYPLVIRGFWLKEAIAAR